MLISHDVMQRHDHLKNLPELLLGSRKLPLKIQMISLTVGFAEVIRQLMIVSFPSIPNPTVTSDGAGDGDEDDGFEPCLDPPDDPLPDDDEDDDALTFD